MRIRSLTLVIVALLLAGGARTVNADVSLGVSISDGELKSFHLAVGDFYDVPQEQVHMVRSKSVGDEELAVVFFFAQRAQVNPEVILKLRLGGQSWMEIGLHYGITAEAYYVPVEKAPGPPYGKAYGHYKNRKKAQWNDIRLSDAEVVDFVNLKFVSGYYDHAPEEVMKHRANGSSFIGITAEIEKKRTVSKAPSLESTKDNADKKSGSKKSKG